MNKQEINKRFSEILEQNNVYKNEKGIFEEEIYSDYSDFDNIDTKFLNEILESKCPQDKIDDLLFEWYETTECDIVQNWIAIIQSEIEEEINEDDIRDWIYDNCSIKYPLKEIMNIEFSIEIVVQTGDMNYDFINNVELSKPSALRWLIKQQGYSIKQYKNEEFRYGNVFLNSIEREINNTYYMNALSFFIKLSLKEIIELNEKIQKVQKREDYGQYSPWKCKDKNYITIDKKCNCGLVNYWSGGGSVLKIELEKDVKIPLKYIWSVNRGRHLGYSIQEIYGLVDSFWQSNMIKNIK